MDLERLLKEELPGKGTIWVQHPALGDCLLRINKLQTLLSLSIFKEHHLPLEWVSLAELRDSPELFTGQAHDVPWGSSEIRWRAVNDLPPPLDILGTTIEERLEHLTIPILAPTEPPPLKDWDDDPFTL